MNMGYIVIFIILSVFVLEWLLAKTWNKHYFQYGVPLFIHKVKVRKMRRIPTPEQIKDRLPLDEWPPLLMQTLTPNTIAIREKPFTPHRPMDILGRKYYRKTRYGYVRNSYQPIMHSLITFDETTKQVVIKGIANWSALSMLLLPHVVFIIAIIAGIQAEEFGGFLVLFTVFTVFAIFMYISQRQCLSRIAEVAASQWQR